jgi:hypothetical protein
MNPSVSAAIMAHPRREAFVGELATQLDRPATVVWDQVNDRHDTGVRSLEAYDPAATHHLVVQDDAVVCRDLIAGIEHALRSCPQDVPICLYVGRVRPFPREIDRVVAEAGDTASWLTMQGLYWGVGVVIPTADLPDLTGWFRQSTMQNYDRRISTWYQLQDRKVWYPWPCLVDHRDDESLVSGHGSGRFAHRFAGADVSALDLDWDGPVVDVARSKQMDAARQRRVMQARNQQRLIARHEALRARREAVRARRR